MIPPTIEPISAEAGTRRPKQRDIWKKYSKSGPGSAPENSIVEEYLPLVKTVDKRLAFDLELFSRGGMRVLRKIERQNYNVLAARPAISKFERVQLLVGSLWNTL